MVVARQLPWQSEEEKHTVLVDIYYVDVGRAEENKQ